MARMPGTRWLGEHSPRTPMSRYDIVCVHTIVGYAPAHAAHFSVKRDGTILQSRDTRYRSAANLNGNHRVIAIENEDAGEWWEPLTPAQVESNGRILRWAHETHGVPLKLCPNSRPTSRGLAYHRQGIDGNFGGYRFPGRVSGGEVWTNHFGKVCPGDAKIAQRSDILAAARGGSTQSEEDDGMADITPERFSSLMRNFFDTETWDAYDDDKKRKISHLILRTDMWSRRNAKALRALANTQKRILREAREDEAVNSKLALERIEADLDAVLEALDEDDPKA